MKLRGMLAGLAGVGLVVSSSAGAAEPLRASSSLPAAQASVSKSFTSVRRQSSKLAQANSLAGVSIFLLLAAAAGGTLAVVAIAGGFDGDGSSPG